MGPVVLNGEWDFFWNRHVSPESLLKTTPGTAPAVAKLPGSWGVIDLNGAHPSGLGFATYRLRVFLPPSNGILGLKTGDINTAGTVFVNGTRLIEAGKPGEDVDSTVPRLVPMVASFQPDSDILDIVIHVSNFHDREGGIRGEFFLGDIEQILDKKTRQFSLEFVLFGAIFVIGLYHLGLYAVRRKELSELLFGVFCLLIALRTLLTGERYLVYLLPDLSWTVAVKIEILTFYLAVPTFSMFISGLYPTYFFRPVLRIIQLASLAAAAFVVILPVRIGSESLFYYQIFVLAIILFLLFIIIVSVLRKEDGALTFLAGFIVLVLTTVNDIFYALEIVSTGPWVSFGVFAFILSQAYLLSSRFSRTFQRVETLGMELGLKSKELYRKNIELEEHKEQLEYNVIERTESIKRLLDNTGQGFLTFGSDYRIEPFYSKACQTFFPGSIERKNVLELLSSSLAKHDESTIRELLNLVFDGVSSIEMFNEILPSELIVEGRALKLEYRVIPPTEVDAGYRIMLILTDITTERELSEQLKRDEERKEVIVKIAIDKAGFIEFANDMRKRFQLLYELLGLDLEQFDLDALFSTFHTIKGEAGSFALIRISEMAHEIEAKLDAFRNGSERLDAESKRSLILQTREMEGTFDGILREFNEVLPEDELNSQERIYQIAESKFEQLKSFLQDIVTPDQHKQLDEKLDIVSRQAVAPVFRRYRKIAEELALKLEKEVRVELSGTDVEVDMKKFEELLVNLVHLVRNCIDHGLEEPVIRSLAGKPLTGNLRIEALADENLLTLSIADDGQGMDSDQIKKMAVEKEIVTTDEVESLSEEQVLQLIFAPGFSTVKQVSSISGRGVGMGTVKSAVEEIGGNISVDTRFGKGTSFTINIPLVS